MLNRIAILLSAFCLNACAMPKDNSPMPARLGELTSEQNDWLRAQLQEVIGRANIQLAEIADPSRATISVLPPPPGSLEGNSLAMPEIFDLTIENGICLARSRRTGKTLSLTGLPCQAVEAE